MCPSFSFRQISCLKLERLQSLANDQLLRAAHQYSRTMRQDLLSGVMSWAKARGGCSNMPIVPTCSNPKVRHARHVRHNNQTMTIPYNIIQCLDLRKRSIGSHRTSAIPRATVAHVMLLMFSSAQSKIEALLERCYCSLFSKDWGLLDPFSLEMEPGNSTSLSSCLRRTWSCWPGILRKSSECVSWCQLRWIKVLPRDEVNDQPQRGSLPSAAFQKFLRANFQALHVEDMSGEINGVVSIR